VVVADAEALALVVADAAAPALVVADAAAPGAAELGVEVLVAVPAEPVVVALVVVPEVPDAAVLQHVAQSPNLALKEKSFDSNPFWHARLRQTIPYGIAFVRSSR
jgi:hypothetical protein